MTAVEVHHVSSAQAYAKMAFGGKSRSIEELSTKTAYPVNSKSASHGSMTSINEISHSNGAATGQRPQSSSDKSSICSMLDLSLIQRSDMAVDQLVSSRKQLEEEIEVSSALIQLWCS